MPPYQATSEETKKAIGKKGWEIAADFIDDQCLTRFVDKSLEWMKGQQQKPKRKPFFLYLPLTSPHYPVCPLPEFWDKGKAGGYGEFMIETDHHVGRILKYLDDNELAENTIVIFTSDNGPERSYIKRIEEFGHDSRGGFRGGKRDISEGGHRVPFFIRWPAGIKQPGRSNDSLIGQVDILATLAELVGKDMSDDAGEDSLSFAGLFADPQARHERAPLINHSIGGRFSITDGHWKLILPHKKEKTELFHLGNDPKETQNLLDENTSIAKRLKDQLTQIVVNGRTTDGLPQPNDTGHWSDLTWITPEAYSEMTTRE